MCKGFSLTFRGEALLQSLLPGEIIFLKENETGENAYRIVLRGCIFEEPYQTKTRVVVNNACYRGSLACWVS